MTMSPLKLCKVLPNSYHLTVFMRGEIVYIICHEVGDGRQSVRDLRHH